jgi:hypothetical protein
MVAAVANLPAPRKEGEAAAAGAVGGASRGCDLNDGGCQAAAAACVFTRWGAPSGGPQWVAARHHCLRLLVGAVEVISSGLRLRRATAPEPSAAASASECFVTADADSSTKLRVGDTPHGGLCEACDDTGKTAPPLDPDEREEQRGVSKLERHAWSCGIAVSLGLEATRRCA